jgi:hypothetical protein
MYVDFIGLVLVSVQVTSQLLSEYISVWTCMLSFSVCFSQFLYWNFCFCKGNNRSWSCHACTARIWYYRVQQVSPLRLLTLASITVYFLCWRSKLFMNTVLSSQIIFFRLLIELWALFIWRRCFRCHGFCRYLLAVTRHNV